MSLAITYSRACIGMDAPLVTIETHIASGLPSFSIVGLPEAAVREARDRVRSALSNSQFSFPLGRITVNMAPADLPKQGAQFDLAIALGILVASEQLVTKQLTRYEWLGELSLGGCLRGATGVLPAVIACKQADRLLVCSQDNAQEAALVLKERVLAPKNLLEVVSFLTQPDFHLEPIKTVPDQNIPDYMDLSDVKGQHQARRALEIAAAGRHHLLYFGPPGTGKSLLASRLPGILPSVTMEESLEIATIQSIAGQPIHWQRRPFRAPHHSASAVALVGGGSVPRPGEVSLAHRGVLFLDELTEYSRHVLDVLREPLENDQVIIARAQRVCAFPANFQLVAAMNPTPSGYSLDDPRAQRYSKEQIQRYLSRLSGPFLDRIDLHVEVPALSKEVLMKSEPAETSQTVKLRVEKAWITQLERQGCPNSQLNGKALEQHCMLASSEQKLLEKAIDKMWLSARAYHRVLKVARTIADLQGYQAIDRLCLLEALNCRQLEKLIASS